MKKKNEEKMPEQGCGTKMPAENDATNEVVNNETVQEENAVKDQEVEEPLDQDGEMEFHASKKDFLLFMHKMLRVMRDIVLLERSMREFEKDPIFDMLLDLSMVHLKEMNASSKEQKPSDKDCEESDKEDNSDDDDDDIISETFISMKVRKLKD
jgi:hypothetical protein